MSYLSDLIRGLGESYVFRKPGQIPTFLIYNAHSYLRAGAIYNASQEAFFTGLDNCGAIAQVTVADTWTTVCDISGAGGYLGFAMSPGHSSAHSPQLRITADGEAKTFAAASSVASTRLVVGAVCASYPPASATSMPTTVANQYFDYGFVGNWASTVRRLIQRAVFSPTRSMLAVGMPVLRFESSLKVEAQTNINGLSSPDSYAGAAYSLDW